jgi:hypothetical protein
MNPMAEMTEMMEMMKAMMEENKYLRQRMAALNTDKESTTSAEEVNILEILAKALNRPPTSGDSVAANLLTLLMRKNPDLFEVYGTLHTGVGGSIPYYSVRLYLDEAKRIYMTLHISVSIRFNKTHIQTIEIQSRDYKTSFGYEFAPKPKYGFSE